MRISIKSVASLKTKIEAEQLILQNNLEQLRDLGQAKLIFWDDKYDFHKTWLVCENANLLERITGIDGWSDNDDYIYDLGEGEHKLVSKEELPEILRWNF